MRGRERERLPEFLQVGRFCSQSHLEKGNILSDKIGAERGSGKGQCKQLLTEVGNNREEEKKR